MSFTESSALVNHAPAPESVPITLSWQNLNYFIDGKQILFNVNGIVKPGEILAILGSSGAGKSTLLDVLAFRKKAKNIQGEVLFNGIRPLTRTVKRTSAYVQQDDSLEASETVMETLSFYANLKLPNDTYDSNQRLAKAEKALGDLGLSRVRDSRIGSQFRRGISGGEKKRVSVASELLTDPSLLFLDEPTTGLDAYNAVAVMERVSDLAKAGKTIVCTLHQPRTSIFQLCTKLMVLSKGRVVYFGGALAALDYFASIQLHCPKFVNPPDFLIDVTIAAERRLEHLALIEQQHHQYPPSLDANQASITVLAEDDDSLSDIPVVNADLPAVFANSQQHQQLIHEIHQSKQESSAMPVEIFENMPAYANNVFRQIYYVFGRHLRHSFRDPMLSTARIGQTLFISLLLMSLYWQLGLSQSSIQNRLGCLFFLLISQGFGQMQALNDLLQSRDLFNRERDAGVYSTFSYFISKVAVDLPMMITLPSVFALIIYWTIGLQNEWSKFLIFLGFLVLFCIVASSFFLLIGAISPSFTIATIIAPLSMVMLMLFGGFYLNLDSIPVYFIWVYYISWIRYGYEAVVYNEFTGLVFTCTNAQKINGVCPVPNGNFELQLLGMSDVSLVDNAIILASSYVALNIASYLALEFFYREKK